MTIETTIALGPGNPALVITIEGAATFEEASNALMLATVEATTGLAGWQLDSSWDEATLTATGFISFDTPMPPSRLYSRPVRS